MSTNVELTEQELAELKRFTNESDAAVAVRRAMSEYLRFARRMRLKELSGRVEMDDNWHALEAAELKAPHAGPEAGAG